MDTTNIKKVIPVAMAAGLVGHNITQLKKKKKRLPSLAVDNIVGLSLIQATSQF